MKDIVGTYLAVAGILTALTAFGVTLEIVSPTTRRHGTRPRKDRKDPKAQQKSNNHAPAP